MSKPIVMYRFSILVILTLFSFCFAQEEQITITTYYPSPFGSYRELEWGDFPNSRGRLSAAQGSSIEIGGTGTPYIDLSNDMTSDFDFRIILGGNDDLWLRGGRTTCANDNGTPAIIRTGEVWYCTQY